MSLESGSSSVAARLHEILAAYLQVVDAGQAPDRQRLLDDNPDLAESLRSFLVDHDQMRQTGPLRPSALRPAQLLESRTPNLDPASV